MNKLRLIDFDLRQVRASAAPIFAEYDQAVREPRDLKAAKQAKRRATRLGLEALSQALPRDARGLYLYTKTNSDLASVAYIGMASPGTLWGRTEKRLRDETCLDVSQYDRAREDVWDTAYKRMRVSMDAGLGSGSKPTTLMRYAFDHVKTTELFKRSDRILFFLADASSGAIKAAESLLIYSAVSAGAPLINIQERDNLTTTFGAGVSLAMEVIRESGIGGDNWTEHAMTLLGRFRGDCC